MLRSDVFIFFIHDFQALHCVASNSANEWVIVIGAHRVEPGC
jgi:hypothetical protein